MFNGGKVWHGLSHDPMDNNVEKIDQCSVITAKILANCRFRKRRGNMKLLSADDMREFINQKKTNNSRRIKRSIKLLKI